jgi:hypothetical protein
VATILFGSGKVLKWGRTSALIAAFIVACLILLAPGSLPSLLIGASYDGGALPLLLIAACLLVLLLRALANEFSSLRFSPLLPCFAYILISLVAFCADSGTYSQGRLAFAGAFSLSAGVLYGYAWGDDTRLGLLVACALISVQSLIATGLVLSHQEPFHSAWLYRAGGTFRDPSELAFCSLIGFCMAEEVRRSMRGVFRHVFLLCGISCLVSVVLSWSREAVVACSVVLLMRTTKWRMRSTVHGMAVLAVGLLLLAVRYSNSSIANSTNRSTYSRLLAFREGWELAGTHWPWGVGPAAVRLQLSRGGGEIVLLDTKNLFLNWIAELGVVGVVSVAWFLIATAALLRHKFARFDPIFFCLIVIGIIGLTDVPVCNFNRPAGNFIFGYLAVLCSGRWKWPLLARQMDARELPHD